MPEGDTLHRIARALQVLVGRQVTTLELPRQAGVGASIAGAVVDEVTAVGKNLVIGFDTGLGLHTHLKMTGSWHLYDEGVRWQRPASTAVVVLRVQPPASSAQALGLVAVCFSAPVVRLIERRRIERELADVVVVDLLGDAAVYEPDTVLSRLRARDAVPLGEVLLDQTALAGVGNVYKSEALFRRGLDPFAPVGAYDDDTLRDLVLELRALMQMNMATPGAISRVTTGALPVWAEQPAQPTVAPVSRKHGVAAVYGRQGERCFTCQTPIEMKRQGEQLRSTYFCPICQPPRVS